VGPRVCVDVLEKRKRHYGTFNVPALIVVSRISHRQLSTNNYTLVNTLLYSEGTNKSLF
jgi:hypothetical protein